MTKDKEVHILDNIGFVFSSTEATGEFYGRNVKEIKELVKIYEKMKVRK